MTGIFIRSTAAPHLVATILSCLVFSLNAAHAEDDGGLKAYLAGDYVRALAIDQPLATQGDAQAQVTLGMMYQFGKGLKQSHPDAVRWYLRAANQGDPLAQEFLGDMYYFGHGVTEDDVRAHT